MSAWSLPVTVDIGGCPWAIRSDFRAVLDALAALSDSELTPREQMAACLCILYPDWAQLPDLAEAFHAAMVFINQGREIPENQPPKPRLVDWTKDVNMIAPAVDKVLGFSCRRCEYLHWWEFIGAFYDIGQGTFAEVVSIRSKRARGKKLDKAEQAFARDNADLVDIKKPLTAEEEEFFRKLGV